MSEQTLEPLRDPYDALLRLRALHEVRSQSTDVFNALAVTFKRANNILRDLGPTLGFAFESGERGLPEKAEKALYVAIDRSLATWGDKSNGSLTQEDYEDRLRSVAQLAGPLDLFFREVRVDVNDKHLRQNRLHLLESVVNPVYRIADISRLGGQS